LGKSFWLFEFFYLGILALTLTKSAREKITLANFKIYFVFECVVLKPLLEVWLLNYALKWHSSHEPHLLGFNDVMVRLVFHMPSFSA